jgi:uncharacterized protein YxjI
MSLYIRERIFSWAEQYDVLDDQQKQVYSIKGEVFSFGHKIHIMDSTGKEAAFIKEKVFSLFHTFEIYIGGQLQGTIKEKFAWFHSRYNVDFMKLEVEGDIFDWNYEMKRGEQVVATIARKILSWANVFSLEYSDPKDELPILALAIAIDAAHSDDESASFYYYYS